MGQARRAIIEAIVWPALEEIRCVPPACIHPQNKTIRIFRRPQPGWIVRSLSAQQRFVDRLIPRTPFLWRRRVPDVRKCNENINIDIRFKWSLHFGYGVTYYFTLSHATSLTRMLLMRAAGDAAVDNQCSTADLGGGGISRCLAGASPKAWGG